MESSSTKERRKYHGRSPNPLKNVIILTGKCAENIDKENLSARGYDMIISDRPSIIDLPAQLREELIRTGDKRITFKAISWCMFPVIWKGDILKIEAIKPQDAAVGDIVLYKSMGRAYAHRLVKIYEKENKLYIATSGEKEFRYNRIGACSLIPADNILGKVIEIKRGKLCLGPDQENLSLAHSLEGRLRLLLWKLMNKLKYFLVICLTSLQRHTLYRHFFSKIIHGKISFFIGMPIIKNGKDISNFCLYQKLDELQYEQNEAIQGLFHLSARIINWPIGNISLLIKKSNSRKDCTLTNFKVRLPFRGLGIGYQLAKRAVYVCKKFNINTVRIVLTEKNDIALKIFEKLNFVITYESD